MLKKMQNRFILAAMAAFGFVMILLEVGINVTNYMQITASQDAILDGIHEYNRKISQQADEKFSPIYEMDWAGGAETEFTKRFFVVWCDEKGNATLLPFHFINQRV